MKLTSYILASGKTRANIVEEVGISQAYLSLLENGKRTVSLSIVARLASSLGVSPSVLRPDVSEVFSSPPSSEALTADNALPSIDCKQTVSKTQGNENLTIGESQ